jgi:predicted esterase YcpF (UPF0227 family)
MAGPSKMLLGLEAARCIYEYGLGWLLNTPLQFISPPGDGHPVIVIPGLGGSDGSTQYIRNFIDGLGYRSHTWGLGRNLGPRHGQHKLLKDLTNRVAEISEASNGAQISLIGWSLGGIYGREIAKVCPDLIRQVITLGSPFKSVDNGTNAARVYEILSKDKTYKNPDIVRQVSQRPPVPFTSLYSKTDGIVNWRSSIEDETSLSENIEVPGASHMGIGHNPIAMYIIADRLKQTRANWAPYKPK